MKIVKEQMMQNLSYWHKWWAWHPVWITVDGEDNKKGLFKRRSVFIWFDWVERRVEDSWGDSYSIYREIKEG